MEQQHSIGLLLHLTVASITHAPSVSLEQNEGGFLGLQLRRSK